MKLSQLQYFAAVCKYNNITKAAAELHISQPSVSTAIRELEDEFGIALFFRTNRGLSLTEEGHILLKKATPFLESAAMLETQMRDLGDKKKNIRVGVPPMLGTILFPQMFQRFHSKYPDIRLHILEHGSVQTYNLVAEGVLDVAIVATDGVESLHLDHTELCRIETAYCVSATHRLADREFVDFDVIRNEPLVLFKEDSYQAMSFKRMFQSLGITPNVVLYSSQLHTIKELVLQNIGASVLFHGIVKPNDGIVEIPFQQPIVAKIELVWNKRRSVYSDIVKFIDFVRSFPIVKSNSL